MTRGRLLQTVPCPFPCLLCLKCTVNLTYQGQLIKMARLIYQFLTDKNSIRQNHGNLRSAHVFFACDLDLTTANPSQVSQALQVVPNHAYMRAIYPSTTTNINLMIAACSPWFEVFISNTWFRRHSNPSASSNASTGLL